MLTVTRAVEEGYASVLIMEDDMDWDVRLKKQLLQFAKGARFSALTSIISVPLILEVMSYPDSQATILNSISSSIIEQKLFSVW